MIKKQFQFTIDMKSIKCSLFIVFQLACWFQLQNVASQETKTDIHQIAAIETQFPLAKSYHHDLRGIKEVWNKIKRSAANAWNFVKNLANTNTKKINIWRENVKERAEEITKSFKSHMKELKEKIHNLIKNTFGNREVVKKCIEQENNVMQGMIKQIMKQMTTCISDKLSSLSLLNHDLLVSRVNDTDFFKDLEYKFQTCEQDPDTAEDCLNKVRDEVFNDVENTENDLLKSRGDSRKIVDDLMSAMLACSIDGLLDAASLITVEAAKITKCIIKG